MGVGDPVKEIYVSKRKGRKGKGKEKMEAKLKIALADDPKLRSL